MNIRSRRFRTDTPRGPFGPTVLPGTYKGRLTVDGKPFTAPLTVKMDPRVKTPLAGLQMKEQAETRLASITTQTTQALLQANSIRAQLEKLSQPNDTTKMLWRSFKRNLRRSAHPADFCCPIPQEPTLSRINGEASTVYQQIWSVDAEPTSAQMEALDATERSSAELLKRWTDLKNTAVPELNRALRQSQAPEVHIEDHPPQIESTVDEE